MSLLLVKGISDIKGSGTFNAERMSDKSELGLNWLFFVFLLFYCC